MAKPFNSRLDDKGFEKLDPKPVTVYAVIDPQTGEVLKDGRPRPASLEETINRALRFGGNVHLDEGDENDDDFDMDDSDDHHLPLHSPHTEGFVDAMGVSVPDAIKQLQKSGYAVYKPKNDAPADEAPASPPQNQEKGSRPHSWGAVYPFGGGDDE